MEQRIIKNTFFNFFLPTLASSITLSVISMTDLIIAGRFVGEIALTSISLALPIIIFIQIIAALLGTGGAIALSTKLGESDLSQCSRIFTFSLGCSAAVGILVLIAGLFFTDPIILLCGGNNKEVIEYARAYFQPLLLGMPFMILSPVMITYLRNDNEQSYSMICVVTCGLFNLFFSALFAGFFNYGIRGIAAATVFSQMLSCVLASLRLFRKNRMFHLVRITPSPALFLSIIQPGLPIAAIFLSQVILTVVINRLLMLEGGSAGVAVYAVIKYLINFMYALFDGVTGAIQPMLGIYYGEKEQNNIHYTVKYSLSVMFIIAIIMFFSMEFFGLYICSLFGVESGTLTAMTISAMRIEGIFCLTAGIITYINAFYRCTGNEKLSFILSIADNLVFPIIYIALFTQILSLGISGIWWGLVASGFSTLLCWFIYCLIQRKGFLMLSDEQFIRPSQEYHVIYPATLEQMEILLPSIENFCSDMKISMKKEYYITLSIEELVINVINLAENHNNHKKQSKEYYVDIRISPLENGEVGLRIRDNLTEFNPGALSTDNMMDMALKDNDTVINELGIGMVKRIAKDYSYKRTIGFNNFSVILP